MIMRGQCALCRRRRRLSESHIVPKFAVEWLKRTSATGYIREPLNPNMRKQDICKGRLLCATCETRLSKWETRFAERVFVPYHGTGQRSFKYEEWLLLFAVSLAWRTAVNEAVSFRKHNPPVAPFVEGAANYWRALLLRECAEPGPYDHHMFFLDFIERATGVDLPEKMNRYLLTTVDSTIASSARQAFAYTKLPGFIFWSGIRPPKPEGWDGTRISQRGVIDGRQRVAQRGFGEFVVDRCKNVTARMSNISDKQHERIVQTALKDPDKAIASLSHRCFLADRRAQKGKKA